MAENLLDGSSRIVRAVRVSWHGREGLVRSDVTRRTAMAGACLLATGAPGPTDAQPVRPRRVISLFPCIDAILLRVADPEQIAGLSALSHEAEVSSTAQEAQPYPSVRDDAESLLARRPDLVVVSRYTAAPTLRALSRAGVATLVINPQLSIAESLDQVRKVAARVGHADRGDALALRISQAVARAAPDAGRTPIPVLVFQTGGFVAGTGTLIDDMLVRTGFKNIAPLYGVRDFADLPLERLVANPPALLLAAAPRPGAPNWGDRVLRHPALLALKDRMRIESFPESLLLCGGPVLLQTAPRLALIRRRMEGVA